MAYQSGLALGRAAGVMLERRDRYRLELLMRLQAIMVENEQRALWLGYIRGLRHRA
jgi:hypothetical protein